MCRALRPRRSEEAVESVDIKSVVSHKRTFAPMKRAAYSGSYVQSRFGFCAMGYILSDDVFNIPTDALATLTFLINAIPHCQC